MTEEVGYGVFRNIHPSETGKRVTLHKLPCHHYKQHLKKGTAKAKGMYTFHKDCRTFQEAVERASLESLEWHAPIKVCKGCLKNWNLV
ncbi:MAG: hypothetical protein JSV30_04525 [Candidatus Omnitrophota bacterium]|nr:MAG: hypothetical protein JSV30_04525 [Candidatus Omnitrophota bacterium]